MFELMIGAFIIALIAGALGFTNVAGAAMSIAQILFGVFLFLALGILFLGLAGVLTVF